MYQDVDSNSIQPEEIASHTKVDPIALQGLCLE